MRLRLAPLAATAITACALAALAVAIDVEVPAGERIERVAELAPAP